jgi:phosphoribosylformylglycinamidine synthase subunit PurQ / glutaminase
MATPEVCILKAPGINCDRETAEAFRTVDSKPTTVYVSELVAGEKRLSDFDILVISGGFSHGDDLGAGVVLANELVQKVGTQLQDFSAEERKLMLGICNGDQTLVAAGLLPFGNLGVREAALTNNQVGHFRCGWVDIKIEPENPCEYLRGMDSPIQLMIAHAEGRFFTEDQATKIEEQKLVVGRYIDQNGNWATDYPINPNGAINAIAILASPNGRILGSMPHFERSVVDTHPANWRRTDVGPRLPQGIEIIRRMVDYAKAA